MENVKTYENFYMTSKYSWPENLFNHENKIDLDTVRKSEFFRENAKLKEEDAKMIAIKKTKGEVIGVDYDIDDQMMTYHFEVLKDGHIFDVKVNAENGKIKEESIL